jgi:hypothetical protein
MNQKRDEEGRMYRAKGCGARGEDREMPVFPRKTRVFGFEAAGTVTSVWEVTVPWRGLGSEIPRENTAFLSCAIRYSELVVYLEGVSRKAAKTQKQPECRRANSKRSANDE